MAALLDLAVLGEMDVDDIDDALIIELVGIPRRNKKNRSEQYGRFNIDNLTPEEIYSNFRFTRAQLIELTRALQIPVEVRTEDGHVTTGFQGLCICLRRLAYPNRLCDLEPLFGLSSPYSSQIANTITNHIFNYFEHLLSNLNNLTWLNYDKLLQYSHAIADKNAPLLNCWGFIDGTARPICRPSDGQQEYFSGHKRVPCIKYQSVVCPDGIICSLMGPYLGCRHDAGILRESNLYTQLERRCKFNNGQNFVLYAVRELLIAPFRNRRLTDEQQNFNTRMSSVRQAVEWGFGKIIAEFTFFRFKKKSKVIVARLEKNVMVAAILTNCHTCLNGSQTSQYFNVVPLTLQQYLTR